MSNQSLAEELFAQLQGAPLQQVSQQLGVGQMQASGAVAVALPLLLGALGKNAAQPQGAEALFGALQKDHAGLDLGSVLGAVLGGGSTPSRQTDGAAILGHIFGGAQPHAEASLGHLLNNAFKFALLRTHVHRPTLLAFGLPAIGGAFAGAWLLGRLGSLEPLYHGARHAVGPLQVTIALLMALFALLELSPALKGLRFGARWRTVGGMVSGLFGGLSGHQGALRSMFLVHGGLSKEGFVATGTAIALLVDLARIPVYLTVLDRAALGTHAGLLTVCVLAAFAGAWWGRKLLPSLTRERPRHGRP